jgi:hypothetical protein
MKNHKTNQFDQVLTVKHLKQKIFKPFMVINSLAKHLNLLIIYEGYQP